MKRYTTIMLFSFIILTTLNAQIKCDFINNASNSSLKVIGADILNWSDYTGYDYTNTAIKVVRLTFHIIQKNDGTNNFINNTISNQFLSVSTMTALNNSMSTNVKMNLGANLAPFQLDTRIRFELANIYYWNDDYDNVYRDNNGYNMITKYVVNKPNVMFKDNSVHIFFCMDGGACGYAGYGGQYVILSDMSISPASSTYLSIKHELGHCMGLQHSWIADDECDDTPPNPNCWDENQCQGIPSNNMMDYNNSESALTQCQINKMHNTLLRGGSVPVSKCVANILSFDSPYLQSNSEFLCLGNSPNTSKVVKLPFGVTVDWIPPSITDYYISIIKKGNTFSIVTQASIKENGQITARLNYGKLGYMDFKKNIFINGFQDIVNPSGYISTNVVGKIILTSSPITKIAFRDNIYFYYDESVTLNPGFEVENGGQLSIEKKYDECVEP